ncbi:hypothetical protein DHEL01_v206879 [Diaporthe helianthi]|uniref:Uncharacterized protein n=1 Tax=Diaporthe helianthi TaxID=158607 RepID=A0A2P5HWU6_DIAHE|nr:hypothetical protein DHEL01_v206879 [Diaporthe helianthi]
MGAQSRVVENLRSRPNISWNRPRFVGAARVAGAGERGDLSCRMEAFAETPKTDTYRLGWPGLAWTALEKVTDGQAA